MQSRPESEGQEMNATFGNVVPLKAEQAGTAASEGQEQPVQPEQSVAQSDVSAAEVPAHTEQPHKASLAESVKAIFNRDKRTESGVISAEDVRQERNKEVLGSLEDSESDSQKAA